MVATLRIMLDQLVVETDADLKRASRELARALVQVAPRDCEVEGVVPAGADAAALSAEVPGLVDVAKSPLQRRELAAALQLGTPAGVGSGMIHSASLFAPLVRHDRVHDGNQTVVTVWDLRAWEAPTELPKASAMWRRAMLKRAARHADTVVVPTHAVAERLVEFAPKLDDRVRVIAGAAPEGFAVPTDDVGRRRELGIPDRYVLMAGGVAESDALAAGFSGVAASGTELPVVVIDAPEGEEPAIAELAVAAGLPEGRVHVRPSLDDPDRAAVFGAAAAFVAPSRRTAFPWRVVEALVLGAPVVAADSPVHTEVVVDGGILAADQDALAAGLSEALDSPAASKRLAVLAADRGRAFSWLDAANRVWELHAEL